MNNIEFFPDENSPNTFKVIGDPEIDFITCRVDQSPEQAYQEIKEQILSNIDSYVSKRLNCYPSLPDQLDAIFKGFKDLRSEGFVFNPDTEDWINKIEKIKESFPPS